MVDAPTVERLALSLPEAEGGAQPDRVAYAVRGKGFAWTGWRAVAPRTLAKRFEAGC